MACQTVVGYFFLCMTIHAPVHRHLHPWFKGRFFALTDIPMAVLAFHFSQGHMASMGKEDMVRLLVEPFPMDLFPFLIYLSDFFFFRVLGERIFVAL